jgi:hypothetical protein
VNNVTVSNSIIRGGSAQYGISGTATGTVLRNVEVAGAAGKCIYMSSGGVTIERANLHDCEDGVHGHTVTMRESYVHDLLVGGGRHSDGLQTPVVGKVALTGNRIIANAGANAAVFIQSNFGPVDDVLVQGNRLEGGTFTVYCDQKLSHPLPTNVRFLGNTLVRGTFGYGSVPCSVQPGWQWSGNVDGAGAPVQP